MLKIYKILTFVLLLLLFSCSKEGSITGPQGVIIIETDQNSYTWRQSETHHIITLEGNLINHSKQTYYSRVGDTWAQIEDFLFADNSEGRLEKYLNIENRWQEVSILGRIIEGACITSIEPNTEYKILCTLFSKNDKVKENTGTYRLRLDYHSTKNITDKALTYSDYSNSFKILSD